MDRTKQIIRTSTIGIIANVFLAGFKALVGLLAHSVAIVLDAVNNLSDALSSVITIVGTKLSVRPADRKHPFGYGRVEYFTAIIIAVIVLTRSHHDRRQSHLVRRLGFHGLLRHCHRSHHVHHCCRQRSSYGNLHVT